MDLWTILAIVSRFIVCIVCIILMSFFWKKYQRSKKESPTPNSYFIGLTWYFGVLGFILILVGLDDILTSAGFVTIDLKSQFPNQIPLKFGWISTITTNLIYPMFLALTIIALTVFLIQIYPLEKILNRKKIEIWILGLAIVLCLIVYIPPLYNTLYACIAVLVSYIALLIAFLMNFYLTGVIIKHSAGEVRRRAIMNITGFFFFLIGLIWSMRVGWSPAIYSGFPINADVVFGDIIIFLSALIYWRAFQSLNV